MPVIYADVLIALNWLVDFLMLSATGHLLRLPMRRKRLVLSGLSGGLYACILLLPPLPSAIRLAADVLIAGLMCRIAFPFWGWRSLVKQTAVLFSVSTLFSGSVLLVSSVTYGEYVTIHNGVVYADISPLMLAMLAVFGYLLIRLFERLTRKRMPLGGEYRVQLGDGDTLYDGRALCDSGLHLREPFSGAPVIVAKKRAVLPHISERAREAIEKQIAHPRVRMVPYRTVAGEGLLPAVRPRLVRLQRLGDKAHDITGAYVALCDDLGRGEYEVLVGNDCCEGWREE